MKFDPDALDPRSWLVAAGRPDQPGDPLNQPLVPASNFIAEETVHGYSRSEGTPLWEAFEELIGGLEGGTSVAFSSGMAAVAAVLAQFGAGSHLVLPGDCYHGVATLAEDGAKRGVWTVSRIGVTDTASWIDAAADADLVWLESPSNPLLEVADLESICAAPRRPGSILGVDNTFATALNQQPLDLGADVSMQSATKLIGGHSDLLTGVVTTRDQTIVDRLRGHRAMAGATPGTLETFLALRGARTLAIRLERAQANAAELAARLDAHAAIRRVRYPGFGTIVSFEVDGDAATTEAVCRSTNLIHHATSLGGVDTTMERRAAQAGQDHIPESLIRMSVGIEAVDDLWADLEQALRA